MSEPVRQISCSVHGLQDETFVCQHIVDSLSTGKPVGFHWPSESSSDRPNAWCTNCEQERRKAGGEWTDAVVAVGLLDKL